MVWLSIELPEQATFTTTYRVQQSDINHANHLAAVAVLPIAMHAQSRLLEAAGMDPEDTDLGLMMASSQVDYISESYLDELLSVDIFLTGVNEKSFDLYYCLRNENTDHEVARVKTRMLFYDYVLRRVAAIPAEFQNGVARLSMQAA